MSYYAVYEGMGGGEARYYRQSNGIFDQVDKFQIAHIEGYRIFAGSCNNGVPIAEYDFDGTVRQGISGEIMGYVRNGHFYDTAGTTPILSSDDDMALAAAAALSWGDSSIRTGGEDGRCFSRGIEFGMAGTDPFMTLGEERRDDLRDNMGHPDASEGERRVTSCSNGSSQMSHTGRGPSRGSSLNERIASRRPDDEDYEPTPPGRTLGSDREKNVRTATAELEKLGIHAWEDAYLTIADKVNVKLRDARTAANYRNGDLKRSNKIFFLTALGAAAIVSVYFIVPSSLLPIVAFLSLFAWVLCAMGLFNGFVERASSGDRVDVSASDFEGFDLYVGGNKLIHVIRGGDYLTDPAELAKARADYMTIVKHCIEKYR